MGEETKTSYEEVAIELNQDDPQFIQVAEILSEIQVESTPNPKLFILKYPRRIKHNPQLVKSVLEFLMYFWRMYLAEKQAKNEPVPKMDYSR
jgi:hypothetical protein